MKTRLLFLSFILICSCNKSKENNEDGKVLKINEPERVKSYTSFQFTDSLSKDILFTKKNINNEFEIKNFLVTYYKYDKNESTCVLNCIPFDIESNTFSTPYISEIGTDTKVWFLNGDKIKPICIKNSYDYLIYLSDEKDLKKLKMFIPNEDYNSVLSSGNLDKYNYTDVVSIKGEFLGIDRNFYIIGNAEIKQ
jgi:hypothetical protein